MTGYIEAEGINIKDGCPTFLDGVIIDIDGVVIDVSGSFRQTIVDTVQYYFEKVIKVPGNATLLTLWDTQAFKNAGGFNNDWNLSKAAVLFFLSKLVKAYERDLVTCRYKGDSLFEFLRNVSLKGGGLEAAKEAAFEKLNPTQRKQMLGLYNPIYIKKIFQEIYGGTDYCKRLYGFDPKMIKNKGLINKEKVMLKSNLLRAFCKVGILTGRTLAETDIALSSAGLGSLVPREFVSYDTGSGPGKPDPACLIKLCEKMSIKNGIYVGDTVDDAMLVANYNAYVAGGRFNFAVVTGRPDSFFGKADIISDDVNKILRYLSGLIESKKDKAV